MFETFYYIRHPKFGFWERCSGYYYDQIAQVMKDHPEIMEGWKIAEIYSIKFF